MLLRLLFVLLIALNIAVAAWLLLGDSGTHAIDPNDGGVPKLKLLAELPVPPGSAAPTAPAASSTVAAATSSSKPAVAGSASVQTAQPTAAATAAAKPSAAAAAAPTNPLAAATTTASTSPRRSYRCLALGPFANQVDLRAARSAPHQGRGPRA